MSAGVARSLKERVVLRLPRQGFTRKRVYVHYKKELANC